MNQKKMFVSPNIDHVTNGLTGIVSGGKKKHYLDHTNWLVYEPTEAFARANGFSADALVVYGSSAQEGLGNFVKYMRFGTRRLGI